ncbi:MAG: hypothetical protein SPC25_02760 [Atopobiaceae bacterium]|nr:hypothetical protein [Atopobiaceae bacterium]
MDYPEDPSDKTRVDVATRVAHPDSPDGAGASQPQRVRGVFDDFSVTQVIASALSAVTSLLLSTKIGIVGGVVGAAVGAAVAAIATQVYKGLLSASADKLRDAAGGYGTGSANDPDLTMCDATEKFVGLADIDTDGNPTVGTEGAPVADPQTRVAPASYIQARRKQRNAQMVRGFVIVVGAALVAVGLTAAIVRVTSAGQGWGARPDFSVIGLPQPQTDTTIPADTKQLPQADQGSGKPATTTGSTDASQDGTSGEQGSSGSTGNSGESAGNTSGGESGGTSSGTSQGGTGGSSSGSSASSGTGTSGGTVSGGTSNNQQGNASAGSVGGTKQDSSGTTTTGTTTAN